MTKLKQHIQTQKEVIESQIMQLQQEINNITCSIDSLEENKKQYELALTRNLGYKDALIAIEKEVDNNEICSTKQTK